MPKVLRNEIGREQSLCWSSGGNCPMLPNRDVEEPNHEKKCNDDYPQNRQYENSTISMSMSVFIVHFRGGSLDIL